MATEQQLPPRPSPMVTPESQPYWDGLRDHQLLVQQCADCGMLRHYPRPMCDACYSFEVTWKQLAPSGRIHSWAVSHHPFHLAFKSDVPYITLTVDMADGIRLHAPLRGETSQAVAIGQPVCLMFEDIDATLTLPCFEVDPGDQAGTDD